MIVFVVEGEKTEPNYFESLCSLFIKDDFLLFPYGTGFGTLYKELKENEDWDLQGHLLQRARQMLKKNISGNLKNYYEPFARLKRADMGDIYLFFDYDAHNKNLMQWNSTLDEMLSFFNDETGDRGKLYVSFPMVEALQHTKKLPDVDYINYEFEISKAEEYKTFVRNIWSTWYSNSQGSDYKNFLKHESNWKQLIKQNVSKANYICYGDYQIPKQKKLINQQIIFDNQKSKFVSNGKVSVLSSIPIFLWEYLK